MVLLLLVALVQPAAVGVASMQEIAGLGQGPMLSHSTHQHATPMADMSDKTSDGEEPCHSPDCRGMDCGASCSMGSGCNSCFGLNVSMSILSDDKLPDRLLMHAPPGRYDSTRPESLLRPPIA